MATIFTKIAQGEIPSYKVAEDENYYAFRAINPLTKGHPLVIPKREEDYFFDLSDEELAGMIKFAKRIAQKQKEVFGCKKVATIVLGLEVPHAHIHLIPMNNEADVDFRKPKLQLTPEEFAQIAESIRVE